MKSADFDKMAEGLRNWGRWGPEDQRGTLNHIDPAALQRAAGEVKQGKMFALGLNFDENGPQFGGFRFNPMKYMTAMNQKHSEEFPRSRFNDDVVHMPLQCATQWDALSHVYYEDKLYNGFPAGSVTSFGAYHCGIDKVDGKGITSRGVLLDVVRHRGAEVFLEPGNPITPAELDEVARAQGVSVGRGDIVLVHTGWWTRFQQNAVGSEPGSGLDWTCAAWMHDHEIAAIAADNLMVEDPDPANGVEGTFLPMHMLCLRDMGLMLGEYWDLGPLSADCAADGVYEFQLIAPPLRVVGAVGSPVNPIVIK